MGRFGDIRSIGSQFSEMRIDYGPGYRLYFLREGNSTIVFLCGGDKDNWRARHTTRPPEDPSLSFATFSRIVQALGMKLTATTAEEPPEEICHRPVSREDAQGEILELLGVEPDLCYDDIFDRLRIEMEMEMVVDICIALEDEGVIKADV